MARGAWESSSVWWRPRWRGLSSRPSASRPACSGSRWTAPSTPGTSASATANKEGLGADVLQPRARQRPPARPRPLRHDRPAGHRPGRRSTQSRRRHHRRAGRRRHRHPRPHPRRHPVHRRLRPAAAHPRAGADRHRPRCRGRQRRPQSGHGRAGAVLRRVRRGADHPGGADRRRRLRWRSRPPRPRRRDAGPGRRAVRRPLHPARRSRHRLAFIPTGGSEAGTALDARIAALQTTLGPVSASAGSPPQPALPAEPRPPPTSSRSSAIPSGRSASSPAIRGDVPRRRRGRARGHARGPLGPGEAAGRLPRRGGGAGSLPHRRARRNDRLLAIGTGDGQTDVEIRGVVDLGTGNIGVRLEGGYNRQLAGDVVDAVAPPTEPFPSRSLLTTVRRDPG